MSKVTAKQPLAITGLGMISCLGTGAEVNAAAMRCGYDGFQETPFMQPYHAEPQLGAMIELENKNLRGIPKLAYLCQQVINEATAHLKKEADVQLLLCLSDIQGQANYLYGDSIHNELLAQIKPGIEINQFHPQSRVYRDSRCGFTNALKQAQQSLYQEGIDRVLIVGVDSLLNSATLAHYGGSLYGENRRLLGDGHSNGFIPGEAATAVLLEKQDTNDNTSVLISGIGTASETATLSNEDEVLKGNGLAEAIRTASKQSGIEVHDMGHRVASVSGEDYFFTETALVQIKTLKQKVPDQPLWHPADSIGEVGAAVGGAMTIMTNYALIKGYSPQKNVLCHISSDNEQRGAFVMQYLPLEKGH